MGKNIAVRLGRNIAAARKACGKTQAEVAEKVEIDTVSLSRIERGVVAPGITTLDRLAETLGVPLGALFNGASSGSVTLADTIAVLLQQLDETDRIFLLEQMQMWVKKLSRHRHKNCPNKLFK